MVELLGVIGLFIEHVRTSRLKTPIVAILIIFIALITIRTVIRNADWKDSITLYNHDNQVYKNFATENDLGCEYILDRQYEKAIYHLQRAINYSPHWYRNWYNLGLAYHLKGDISSAKTAYETTLRLNPDYLPSIENLGSLYLNNYNIIDSTKLISAAVKKYPQSAKLWYYLSLIYYKSGNTTDALNTIKKALALNATDPDITTVYYQMLNNTPSKYT